jgi:gamma-glutamyltranspeptidase/glutathione hydrolase
LKSPGKVAEEQAAEGKAAIGKYIVMRDIHQPGRSAVHGTRGAIATSQPLATATGFDILRRGGNAIDAAIAASAVLCVVEPMSTGIGGDCFALYAPKGSGDVIGLNGSGRAPAALNADVLLAEGIKTIDQNDVHAVTIPGAVDAWATLIDDHGTMSLADVLAPAIKYAEEGFAISPVVGAMWRALVSHVGRRPEGALHLLNNGEAPRVGEIFKSPVLAQTFREIAAKGRAGFYEGPVARDMVSFLRSLGGKHTMEDFAATRADYVTPIRTPYGPYDVLEIPPNGQGITALIMLNILKQFDLEGLDPAGPERIHLEMEAQRLAFEMRDAYVADQDFGDVPVEAMLSKATAAKLAARISADRAMGDVCDASGDLERDTIYLSVVDADRNAVSFINSVYTPFGSGLVAPKTAVTFQNRGAGFVVEPGHPNCVEGGKRPKHTIIPGMLVHNQGPFKGKAAGPFGVMGGDYQAIGHTHVVANLVHYAMDPQQALDCPRTFYQDGKLLVETTITPETRAALEALGHTIGDTLMPFGGGQMVLIDWGNGTLVAGSEPRKDGLALAY